MAFKPPRTIFLDFPIGCPAGKPNVPELQRDILRTALNIAPQFSNSWKILDLPYQWSSDGGREWEEHVRDLYRKGIKTVDRHVADHLARGESLIGKEKEFTILCNC